MAFRDSLSTAACCEPGWITSSTFLGLEPFFLSLSTFSFVNGKPVRCPKLYGARAICNNQIEIGERIMKKLQDEVFGPGDILIGSSNWMYDADPFERAEIHCETAERVAEI